MFKKAFVLCIAVFALCFQSQQSFSQPKNFVYPLVVQKSVMENWKKIHSDPLTSVVMQQSCYLIVTEPSLSKADYLTSDLLQERLAKCYLYISRPNSSFSKSTIAAYSPFNMHATLKTFLNIGKIDQAVYEKGIAENKIHQQDYEIMLNAIDAVDLPQEVKDQGIYIEDVFDDYNFPDTKNFRRTIKYLFRYYDNALDLIAFYNSFHAGVFITMTDFEKEKLIHNLTEAELAEQTLFYTLVYAMDEQKFSPNFLKKLQAMFDFYRRAMAGEMTSEQAEKEALHFNDVSKRLNHMIEKEILTLDVGTTLDKVEAKAKKVPDYLIVPLQAITGE